MGLAASITTKYFPESTVASFNLISPVSWDIYFLHMATSAQRSLSTEFSSLIHVIVMVGMIFKETDICSSSLPRQINIL
jgi:heme/copper-type cytochrome/quinol oxidase subunit 4